MRLKETVKNRILVKENASKVIASTMHLKDGIKKIDKESMRSLLSFTSYKKEVVRDLELYKGYGNIIVLDNELPVYTTDTADVVIRKSPILKEMINIKNIIKILWDSSVVICKGKETVLKVHDICLSDLEIKSTEEELRDLKYEGIAVSEVSDYEGMVEILRIFYEILDLEKQKKPYQMKGISIFGKTSDGEKGPFVIENNLTNEIWFYGDTIKNDDKESVEDLLIVAKGFRKAAVSGAEVFEELCGIASNKD